MLRCLRPVTITIPIKRGLKVQSDRNASPPSVDVTITIPIKRGLKVKTRTEASGGHQVTITIPIKRGLKVPPTRKPF